MIEKYLHLYDSLVKEFHLPEDKAKETIRAVYESSGTQILDKERTMLLSSPENIYKLTHRNTKTFKARLLSHIKRNSIYYTQPILWMLFLLFVFHFLIPYLLMIQGKRI